MASRSSRPRPEPTRTCWPRGSRPWCRTPTSGSRSPRDARSRWPRPGGANRTPQRFARSCDRRWRAVAVAVRGPSGRARRSSAGTPGRGRRRPSGRPPCAFGCAQAPPAGPGRARGGARRRAAGAGLVRRAGTGRGGRPGLDRPHLRRAACLLPRRRDRALHVGRHVPKGIAYDALVLSEDPGPVGINASNANVNRQLVSTLAGIVASSRPLVVKVRSDLQFHSAALLREWGRRPDRGEALRVSTSGYSSPTSSCGARRTSRRSPSTRRTGRAWGPARTSAGCSAPR